MSYATPYATISDLIDRYGLDELTAQTDRADPAAGAPDPVTVGAALDDAAVEIDGYLAGRYPLPLPAVPPLLRTVACALARHRLWPAGRPEAVQKDCDDARRQLREIAAGTIRLDSGSQPAPPAAPPGVRAVSSPRVFDAATLAGFGGGGGSW